MRDQEKVGGMVAQIERKLTHEEHINMLVQSVCSCLGYVVSKVAENVCALIVPKVVYVALNYVALLYSKAMLFLCKCIPEASPGRYYCSFLVI